MEKGGVERENFGRWILNAPNSSSSGVRGRRGKKILIFQSSGRREELS